MTLFCLLLSVLMISSCSLDYGKDAAIESSVPELNFFDATMRRTENNNLTIELKAGQLEQYKDSDVSFAKNVDFKTWSKTGEEETEGQCDLISVDRGQKQYNLFGNILLFVKKEKMKILAKNLMWNGKREQLISSKNDEVSIFRDDIEITGTGFSASGVSKAFNFNGGVNGVITQENETSGDSDLSSK